MREIVFDTETTGTDPQGGDRIVEIGGIELLHHVPTGKQFHAYLNPERAMSEGAFEVHGLSDAFLAEQRVFAAIADELCAFFGDAKLIAHNAAFDLAFINAEFGRLGRPHLPADRVIDTLALARRRHPGASNSLDALCARYGIDNTRRTKHGALLDAELLAEVYIELIGGRQADLALGPVVSAAIGGGGPILVPRQRPAPPDQPRLTPDAVAAHRAFVATLGEAALWRAYDAEA